MSKPVQVFAPEGLGVEENALEQMTECLEHPQAVKGALMADHHLGYSMPIGGVVAYQDAISPTGVGFDIACGNMAVQTDVRLRDFVNAPADCPDNMIPNWDPHMFNEIVKPTMRQIQKRLEFGIGKQNAAPVDDPVMDDSSTWDEITTALGPGLREKARVQLGTVGSGNHYVDLLVDEDGWLWVANHFGSRGFGHTLATYFIEQSGGKGDTKAVVLPTDTDLGEFYVAAMHLAGKYAYAGREFVMDQVLDILGAKAQATVHNHHNFAWLENGLWVVRKGATPLTEEPAFIGGSMGDISVIVRGKTGTNESGHNPYVYDVGAIGSAPHGAGRVMSRNKAAGKMKTVRNSKGKKFKVRDKSTAAIDWDAARATLLERGITVLGAGADESPGVYKPLAAVLEAHMNIVVTRVLRPIGVVMASPDTYDPYKD